MINSPRVPQIETFRLISIVISYGSKTLLFSLLKTGRKPFLSFPVDSAINCFNYSLNDSDDLDISTMCDYFGKNSANCNISLVGESFLKKLKALEARRITEESSTQERTTETTKV